MKKFAKKTILHSLASACFVGTSCCSALLWGQQLVPIKKSTDDSLPPIVAGKSAASQTLPPIIRGSSNTGEVPPVVSVTELMKDVDSGINSTIQRGKNFPTDGESRIAEFVQSNGSNANDVANTSYGMPQESPSDYTPAPALAPVVPVPVPDMVPQPMSSVPSIGGQSFIQAAPTYQAAPAQQGPQYTQQGPQYTQQGPQYMQQGPPVQVGTENYFESAPVDNYGGGVVDYGSINSTFDCCGFICDARNYLIVDALYWERDDGVFRASNINFIDDFDHSWGGRITYGSKRDSTRGVEASYMQMEPLIANSSQLDGGTLFGGLFGNAITGDLPASAFTAFRNGTYAQQFHKSRLHSAEINRTWWGSDVAKMFMGARYIHFDDEFRMTMINNAGQFGFHEINTTNNMFGLHIGGEILYDIGYRLSFSFGAKLGGYVNFSENDLLHFNDGAVGAFGSNDDNDFSWSGEFGAWARYKLSPNVRLRAGYEGLALFDVKDVESAFSPIVESTSGRFYPDGDVLFHGPSIGIEFYR